MFIAALLLIVTNSVIGLDKEKFKDSFVQADFYIQNISEDQHAPENFWALNELASAHPVLEDYIFAILSQTDSAEKSCYLKPFLDNDDSYSPLTLKANRLKQAYECSGNLQLYIALLYEMPADESLAYSEQPPAASPTTVQQELISKAIGQPYSISKLFVERKFDLSDVYLFHKIRFEASEISYINNLLNDWTENYNSLHNFELIDNLLLATIINGHSRLYQDDEVFRMIPLLGNNFALPNSRFKLNVYKRMGFSAYYTGNYRDALKFYRQHLIPLSILVDDVEEQLRIRLDYGSMQFRLGNIQAALREYEIVQNDVVGIQSNMHRSTMMNNLAVTYLTNGDFNTYLQLQLNALEESYRTVDTEGKLHYLNNLYIYYRRNDAWNSAIDYLTEAARVAGSSGETKELASIYASLATYERESNQDYSKAISYLKDSELLASNSGDYRQLLYTKTELYKTYLEIADNDNALQVLFDIMEIAEQRDDETSWLDMQAHIASVYLTDNRVDEAIPYIEILDTTSLEMLPFTARVHAKNVLSSYHLLNGDPLTALSIAQSHTREIMERLKNSADYQSGHLRMDDEFIDNFQLLTDLLLHLDRPDEALIILDELKNISKFSFYNNPALKSNILNEEELIYDFALSNRIERLRNELRDASESARIGINNQITQAIAEKNKLMERVLKDIDDTSFDLQKVQKKLKRDELLLYYTIFNQKMYLARITSNDVTFITESFSNEDMQRVEQAINDLSNGNTDLLELSWIRSKVLPADLDDNYNKLIVIPDGFLYRLPLEVLPTGTVKSKFSYGSASYLIEDYAISYINSLKDLEKVGESARGHAIDYLGFGISNFDGFKSNLDHDRPLSALPFAEKEVNDINRKLTRLPERKTLTADYGTEKAFRAHAGNSRVMHVASHSEVFHPDPLFSVIYMHSADDSSDYQDDGLVYAYELFEMDLSNEMVMLSSCESGSGSYIQGSGIVGLSRAFTYAGARSLVMNLWSIRDETASNMAVSFYDYLNQGYSKDAALRKAKIDYINNNSSDPYLWGSFVVYGDDSPIVARPLARYWWTGGIGILLAGLLLVLGRMQRRSN